MSRDIKFTVSGLMLPFFAIGFIVGKIVCALRAGYSVAVIESTDKE